MFNPSLKKLHLKLFCTLCAAVVLLSVTPLHAQQPPPPGGVIVTHFPKRGDMQPAPIRFLAPDYGNYSNMENDTTAVSEAERDARVADLKKAVGIDVMVLNRWEDAQEGRAELQIVNNHPIAGALYTIFLPPNWKKSAKMPIVLSGNGATQSNNQRFWKRTGDNRLPVTVVRASVADRTGLIGVISNAGGTESMGVDQNTLRSVGKALEFLGANGGDPQRVIMAGASRGGGTSIAWAANPLDLPYQAVAVFADIPPVAFGVLRQRSVLTYPTLGNIYIAVTHNPTGYLYTEKSGPGKSSIKSLVGTDDNAEADKRSPIGMADRLKGKTIVIARGTMDALFPFWEFLLFDRRLDELQYPHTTYIMLGQGHIPSAPLWRDFEAYMDAYTQGKTFQPKAGRFYFVNQAPPSGDPIAVTQAGQPVTTLPFTANLPGAAGIGNPVDIAFCGAVGKSFTYRAADPAGRIFAEGKGTFGVEECVHETIITPNGVGEYEWSVTYDGQPISPLHTPRRNQGGCGLPMTIRVLPKQPSPNEITGENASIGFGLDQFSIQEAGCIAEKS
jgi:hypothetical protein